MGNSEEKKELTLNEQNHQDFTKSQLNSHTKDELIEYAEQNSIVHSKSDNKPKLIDSILKRELETELVKEPEVEPEAENNLDPQSEDSAKEETSKLPEKVKQEAPNEILKSVLAYEIMSVLKYFFNLPVSVSDAKKLYVAVLENNFETVAEGNSKTQDFLDSKPNYEGMRVSTYQDARLLEPVELQDRLIELLSEIEDTECEKIKNLAWNIKAALV